VDTERVEVVGETGGRRGEAGAVELADEGAQTPLAVVCAGGLVERSPVGEPDALAL